LYLFPELENQELERCDCTNRSKTKSNRRWKKLAKALFQPGNKLRITGLTKECEIGRKRVGGERGKALTALSSSSCFLGFSLRLSAVFVIYTKQNGKGKQYTIDLNIRMFVCTWVYIFGLLQKRATMTSMRCNNNKHEKRPAAGKYTNKKLCAN